MRRKTEASIAKRPATRVRHLDPWLNRLIALEVLSLLRWTLAQGEDAQALQEVPSHPGSELWGHGLGARALLPVGSAGLTGRCAVTQK